MIPINNLLELLAKTCENGGGTTTTWTPPQSESRKIIINEFVKQTQESLDVYRDAEPEFKLAIVSFLKKISEGTAIANTNTDNTHVKNKTLNQNKLFWGRVPIIRLFVAEIDPIIQCLYPEGRDGYFILLGVALWPLKKQLLESKTLLNDKIKMLGRQLDREEELLTQLLNGDPSSAKGMEISKTCETLSLLLRVLKLINQFVPTEPEIQFCLFCFRRAPENSKFCPIHNSSKNNTEYLRAKRVSQAIPDFQKRMRAYAALRNQEGVIQDDLTVSEFERNSNKIVFRPTLQNFFTQTVTDWNSVRNIWISLIETQLPYVTRLLKQNSYHDELGWAGFVQHIYASLNDSIETTSHPYCVFRYLENAENWLMHDDKFRDQRKTDKESIIIRMAEDGIKQSEIAKKLAVSPAYVSQTLKKRYRGH
ncbi:helix-turn-helix domain-containing protein [Methylicorpusculum sp.]|uniref:helix-turn-helix domain-containing protein n=1 Tax=Methylicorpusculum sp. TaxID=2713644 RepID=UPI00272739E8|nr:helix-turn-helix domain-containing protein [Methylicorpusculum sp.]MDO8844116.1 helix-turn-helix domain-containing protein [Methylicorpusculum sp.]